MTDDVNESLGIASGPAVPTGPGTPMEQTLQQLLAESRKQTRHLSVIRWMLTFAWLTLLLGGIRLIVR